jgi:hypothetical protein
MSTVIETNPYPPEITMHEKSTVQHSIFRFFVDHEMGKELLATSDWLDEHSEILDWLEADLQPLPL